MYVFSISYILIYISMFMKKYLHALAFISSIVMPIVFCLILVTLSSQSRNDNSVLSVAKIFWFSGIVFVITNAVGYLYGSPWHNEQRLKSAWKGWNRTTRKKLVVSYVSRGDNEEALRRAIEKSRVVLDRHDVKYEIETITDIGVKVNADKSLVVPKTYKTKNGAMFKARALHFGCEKREADRHTWVLHLDEESVVSDELIVGISKFLARNRKIDVIGQGEIKYNAHNYGKNALITSIDAIRTGDDIGRFRTQYKLFKKPLFGMHGSFFIVNSSLEKRIGFDLGGRGSITEDAYFALVCADLGVKFQWVDGFIREQSPFTLIELLKQRRRWITGLRLLMWDRNISRKQRFLMISNMTLWRIAWIGPFVTFWNLIAGGSVVPAWASVSAAFISGVVASVYMVGAYRNVVGCELKNTSKLRIWLMAGILTPVSCFIEGIAVLYSIVFRNSTTFDVVAKN